MVLTQIGFRLQDDLVRDFDAYAISRGGRTEALRALMKLAIEGGGGAPPSQPAKSAVEGDNEIRMEFSEGELALIAAEALEAGMSSREWMHSLIRTRISPARQFNKYDRSGFARFVKELREVAISTARAVRHLEQRDVSQPEQVRQFALLKKISLQLERLELGIRYGLQGNDRYWDRGRGEAE
ncbi:MAG: hypothetical protein ACYDD1_01420 [Caulobacteraceae bacterium]